ncbi:N-6 DNA methylase [Streptomyces sp. NPDC008122]|uniref:HsdM family class I SAM-dependent methyltransferase n=1 Tax=Streptomyces sp. NPDC008122 TaxID=3364810 RepID=UPI0036E805DD
MANGHGQSGGEAAGWKARQIADRFWKFHSENLDDQAVTKLEYVEHVAYLLFLKLDHERSRRPSRFAASVLPAGTWPRLTDRSGDALHRELRDLMGDLGEPDRHQAPERATASVLFRDAQPWNVERMSELSRLIVEEIDPYQWTAVNQKELGSAFAQLVADCRADILGKKGTGQILTPPPVLTVLAKALDVRPGDTVVDPAGGPGSSLIAAHQVMVSHEGAIVGPDAIAAADLDAQMCRLATMNILLNTGRPFHQAPPVLQADSLKLQGVPVQRTDTTVIPTVAICNPPFRSNGVRPDSELRDDFWAYVDYPTDFLQHIAITLPIGARAAVFVPDGVLFGAGAVTVRENLLKNCDVHTLLRLPTGMFFGTNSKSNVLFFTKSVPRPDGAPITRNLWVYDARTDRHHTDTGNPVTEADFDDFLAAYRPRDAVNSREESQRFRRYPVEELLARKDVNLNLSAHLTADLQDFGSPRDIALSIADSLAEAQDRFRTVAESL